MSPNLNPTAERFVRSIKDECLDRMIFVGQASLRRAVAEYMSHYHAERNHQGLENRLIVPIGHGFEGMRSASSCAARRDTELLLPQGGLTSSFENLDITALPPGAQSSRSEKSIAVRAQANARRYRPGRLTCAPWRNLNLHYRKQRGRLVPTWITRA